MLEKDENTAALQAYDALIASIEDWAVYAVRRIWKHPNGLIRQTERVYEGTRQQCQAALDSIGEATGIEPVFLALSWRVITIPRTKDLRPSVEETFVRDACLPCREARSYYQRSLCPEVERSHGTATPLPHLKEKLMIVKAKPDKYPGHLFPAIAPDAEYQFAAVQGQQSGRPYWMLNLTVQDIKRMFAEFLDRAEHDPRSLAQRSLNSSRARKVGQYILGEVLPDDDGFYILPPLVVSVDCDEYNFDEVYQGAGQLILPSDSQFWLGDGQHRSAGFLQAYLEAPAIMHAETVGVMLLADAGNKIRHKVFLDINGNASKPSKSLATLFDERDRLADVTRSLLALPWLERYTNLERTTLSRNSADLFTLNGFRDANRELLSGTPESDWDSTALHYWKAIAEVIPQWRDMVKAVGKGQDVEAPALREKFVCFHSIALSALGILGQRIADSNSLKPLAKVDWRRDNPDWEGIFLFEGKIIKNRQSATRFADCLRQFFPHSLSNQQLPHEQGNIEQ